MLMKIQENKENKMLKHKIPGWCKSELVPRFKRMYINLYLLETIL